MSSSQPGTPVHATTDLSQGSQQMTAFLTSPKCIIGLIIFTVLCVLAAVYVGEKWGSNGSFILIAIIMMLGFAARHFIGNKKDKIE